MKNNLFFIGILVTALALSSAIAMGSSMDSGLLIEQFATDSKVYAVHDSASVFCNDVLISTELPVYILPDKDWASGDSITDFVVNTTVTTNSNGRLSTSLIWENPEVGSYDIIIDLNKNGKYDVSDECTDLLDDNTVAGFTVIQATTPEPEETANETVNESTEDVVQEPEPNATVPESNDTEAVTASSSTDYVPFFIIAAAIIVAALIIAVTLRRMH
ncbi:MAG: hypothetical protein PHC66_03180 [Candidatus Nanoarchaeia archaeon]|nr:hypothetical protein [Candidatus Nanoarchaeia archaeon]MDD5239437.1 hypothetical protein [Candidatus Nanoarchaeia archaeon]